MLKRLSFLLLFLRLIHLDRLINYSYSFRKQPAVSVFKNKKLVLPWSGKCGSSYSSIFKAYLIKTFAAAKASLVFIKNRCRSSRSQMFLKIGVFKNFPIFTRKTIVLESLFNKVAGLLVFSCEYCETFKSSFFYRTPPVTASAHVLFYIIFSKRRCWIYCSYTLHNCFILKPKSTLNRFHSLSFVVPLLVIRCTTPCHSLLFIVTCCHLLSLVVTRCTTHGHTLY